MAEVSERSIFLDALEHEDAEARKAFLERACSGNVALRAAVEQLLSAHDLPDNPLDDPVAAMSPVATEALNATLPFGEAIAEGPGSVIGPYRLMEQIGEGGFGLVFVADQQEPVRRKIALKIVKPGMDTREVIARFSAERQALAMMDHPNIAKVYDAGTTETGRPYFVMELVRGVPITEFCDKNDLGLRSRLELFVNVCNAVQHAHQKGVIHRDIKPSNVLVTRHDDLAVPKVIDFGVAKAIGQNLTDKTIYTRFAAIIGTPLYMSPEQAQMSGLDIDTRSDIYSLGVLLYELLTGSTPFERERFDSVGLDELRRIIREEDPPKPSTRLTTAAGALSTLTGGRERKSLQLSTAVRGDLDWIVMKTLEKDRQRRYESASELADDVRRYLNEEPIQARPPSQLYQLQKFARRNKAALITVSLIATIMVLATAVSVSLAAIAVAERNEKDKALNDAVLLKEEANSAREEIALFATRMKEANVLVTSGRAHADAQRWAAAYADFSSAIQRQPNYYNAWTERASLEVKLGLWEQAADDYSKAIELGVPVDNPANWGIPQLFLFTGDTASHREYCLSMLTQAEQQNRMPSIALIRSCVMAMEPVGDPQTLAELSLGIVEIQGDQLSHFDRPKRDPPDGRRGGLFGPPPRRPGEHRESPEDRPRRPPGQMPFEGPQPGGYTPEFIARMWHPRGASLYVTGMALYRAQRYEEAVTKLNDALKDDFWPARPIVYPALAMAYQRSGDSERAQEAFAKSNEVIENWSAAVERGPVGATPIPWFDWIECRLLQREASILLTGFAPADDPRLRDAQQRAQQLIDSGVATP